MNNLPEHDIALDGGICISFTRTQFASSLKVRIVGIFLEQFQELVNGLFHRRVQGIPIIGEILVRDYINLFGHFGGYDSRFSGS